MSQVLLGQIYAECGEWDISLGKLKEFDIEKYFSADETLIKLDQFWAMKSAFYIGLCFEKQGNIANALEYYKKPVEFLDQIKNERFLSSTRVQLILGWCCFRSGMLYFREK